MCEESQNDTSVLPALRLTRSMKCSVRVDVGAGSHSNNVVSTSTPRLSMLDESAAADARHP